MSNKALAEKTQSAIQSKPQTEIQAIVEEAYIYGYPLVIMGITKEVTTNVTEPNHIGNAPINQFSHFQAFPEAGMNTVVRPNLDTLYSIAWLDLQKEPMILSLPEMGDRYYLMQLLDAWTDVFASLGTRTTGNHSGHYAITGPDWKGTLPPGINEVRATTNLVFLIGRTQTNGKRDYETVHQFQKKYLLNPLSQWRKPVGIQPRGTINPNIDMKTPPMLQMETMNALTFFQHLAQLMKTNAPHPADKPLLERMAQIGLVPGEDFAFDAFNPDIEKTFEAGIRSAYGKMLKQRARFGDQVNGWNVSVKHIGHYGTHYLDRAGIALGGLGANLPDDAVYPMTEVDSQNEPLQGNRRYVLHFDKNQLPPVRAFWSVTLYDDQGYLVKNPISRSALGDRDPLRYNSDGSLDIYIQAESPTQDFQDNWLPAPKQGMFNLALRLYWPMKDVLNLTWKPPAVQPLQK